MIDIANNTEIFKGVDRCYGLSIEHYIKVISYFIKQDIKIPCDFRDNTCSKYRSDGANATPPHQRIGHNAPNAIVIGCCCYNCAVCKGYLTFIPKDAEHVYVNKFDTDFGFWRPNVGCILPKVLRSPTCVGFVCNAYKHCLTKHEHALINALASLISLNNFTKRNNLQLLPVEEQFERYVKLTEEFV